LGGGVPPGEALWPLAIVANAAAVVRPNKINGFVFIYFHEWTANDGTRTAFTDR
jgi:hypothetical protein